MDIDAGGQSMQAQAASSMTFETSFTRADQGVQVSLALQEFEASQSTPMGTTRADGSGVEGPVVFSLDRRGRATVVSLPEVTGDAVQFFQPLAMAHSVFPRLPGRAAAVGDSWTDTIRFEGEQGLGEMSFNSVLTYTVVGDTVVSGRSLVRIDYDGPTDVAARGVMQGGDFSQNLSGDSSGWILWDLQRSLMVETHSRGDARGSMEVSAAPFPLSVRVRSQGVVRLQDGG
jgi:hypothetical protein